jgi:hypothetical protein
VENSPFPDADTHVIDASLFILFERKNAINHLERATTEYDVTLVVPQRVYEELTPTELPYETPPVDEAIEAGWVRVVDDIDYANPVVSATMDLGRRYIAAASDRAEDDIEQADTALGGVTTTLLERDEAERVAVYTRDKAAFRGIERALAEHGYDQRVQLVNAFDCYESVCDRYQFQE